MVGAEQPESRSIARVIWQSIIDMGQLDQEKRELVI
jgi:hypothetical protein